MAGDDKRKTTVGSRSRKTTMRKSIKDLPRPDKRPGDKTVEIRSGKCTYVNESTDFVYNSNEVITSRYTAYNFVPKNLWEQFHNMANIYFLAVVCLVFHSFSCIFFGSTKDTLLL